jgi:hypothetical protein
LHKINELFGAVTVKVVVLLLEGFEYPAGVPLEPITAVPATAGWKVV